MNIVCIIPARGGSKGLPRKNVRLLAGKPLIAWTIEAAKAVLEISRVIVNTDSADIAEVSRAFGAEVFVRPKELAKDLTLDLPVFEHHVRALKKKGELPDMVVDLRATAPLRTANRIREGIALLQKLGKENADSVRAVSRVAKHPFKMWKKNGDFIESFLPESFTDVKEPYNLPRQNLPDVYQNNGCMNAFWPETVLEKHSMTGERIGGFLMEEWESVNIDTEIDFLVAEALVAKHQK